MPLPLLLFPTLDCPCPCYLSLPLIAPALATLPAAAASLYPGLPAPAVRADRNAVPCRIPNPLWWHGAPDSAVGTALHLSTPAEAAIRFPSTTRRLDKHEENICPQICSRALCCAAPAGGGAPSLWLFGTMRIALGNRQARHAAVLSTIVRTRLHMFPYGHQSRAHPEFSIVVSVRKYPILRESRGCGCSSISGTGRPPSMCQPFLSKT